MKASILGEIGLSLGLATVALACSEGNGTATDDDAGADSAANTDTGTDADSDTDSDSDTDTDTDTNSVIHIVVNPSKLSGVAPLSVFFDTEGTSASTTEQPIHELHYSWDFGAGTESDTSSGGRHFVGFNSAHVFETPGTYDVTLSVRDAQENTAQETVTIEVLSEPTGGWETYCFSNDDVFSDCPSGATHIQTSYWSVDSGGCVLDYVGQNRRLLLERGDTFSYSGNCSSIGDGPLLFGAFGSGDSPTIHFDGMREAGEWEYPPMVDLEEDIRFTDIHFDLYSGYHGVIGGDGGLLLLRVINENGQVSLGDNIFVVDSILSNIYGNPSYGSGKNITVINTEFGPSLSHSVYGECQPKSIFTGSYFHDVQNSCRTGIRLAANTCSSNNILVSNNTFENLTCAAMNIMVTTHNDERFIVSDVVIEKNRFLQCGGVVISREHGYYNISLKNNIFELSDGNQAISLSTQLNYHPEWAKGVEGLWVYNNLFYGYSYEYPTWASMIDLAHDDAIDVVFENNIFAADGIGVTEGWIHALRASPGAIAELTFRNNLYYFPDMPSGEIFNIEGVDVGDLSWWNSYGGYNLGEGSLMGDPLFVDDANLDFRLQSGSPAIDSGREIADVFEDFNEEDRSSHAPCDIGPYEYVD